MATAAPQVPQIAPAPQAPAPQPLAEPKESPRLTYRSKRDFEMRSVAFGGEVEKQINKWVYEQIDVRQKQLRNRHTSKVPEWRRLASGRPRDENKSWPFENCANLVHPIIGESTDELSSRVLQLIWSIAPIIYYRYLAATKSQAELIHNTKKSRLLEQFMDFVSNDSRELDLYRVENLWFHDSTVLGTAWVCVAPEKRLEMVHIGYSEGEGDLSKRGNRFAESGLDERPESFESARRGHALRSRRGHAGRFRPDGAALFSEPPQTPRASVQRLVQKSRSRKDYREARPLRAD